MPDVKLIIEAIAAAAGLASALILVGGWPWRKPREKLVAAAWPLAVGIGFFAGCWMLLGQLPGWPPQEDADRLLWVIAPAAILAELLAVVISRPRWLGWALRAIVAASAGRILLHDTSYIADLAGGTSDWTTSQIWLYLGSMAAGLFVVWALLDWLAARSPSRSLPLALAMVSGAAGITIMLSGYATGGQRCLPLAAALAAAGVASLLPKTKIDVRGGLGVGLVALFVMLAAGYFFGKLTLPHAVVLFVAPLGCWITELPPLKKLRSWQRGLVQLLVVAIPLAIVVFQAQQQFAADSQRAKDDPYSSYGS